MDAAQVERLAELAIPANSDQAVYLLEAFLEGHPDSVKQLGPVALEALRSSRPDGNAIRFHTWKVLASKVGASNIPDLFRIALDLGPRASYGADLVSLLVDLWQQGDPVALFEDVVAPRLVDENPSRHWATLRRLKGLPIEEVGLDRLVSWIDAGDRAKRAAALATVGGSPDVPLGTLHALLLEISPEAVGSSLWAGFIEGTHMGPESTWLEQKRQTALQWRSDERGHVRDWAGELVAWLDNNLERARQQEAEEALEGL